MASLNQEDRVRKLVGSFRGYASSDRSDFPFMLNPRSHCGRVSGCSSSSQLMIQNYSNFKKSCSPARIMFYQDGSWVDFRGQVIDTVRSAFLRRIPVVELQIDGSEYLFDFLRMLQIDFETENQRSIAWIDEDGKCFFPKVFVDYEEVLNSKENSTNPKIEVEIRIDGITGKRREVSEQKEEAEVNSTNQYTQGHFLKRPRVTAADSETFRWANCKALEEGDRNYASISSLFLSPFMKLDPKVTMTAIHQCTRSGPLERARFHTFHKQIDITRAARGTSNMVYAWYATSRKAVGHILLHGFGESTKVPASDSYGEGVYLSPVASPYTSSLLSEADENGEKHIILCRVILGSVEKVELGSQQSHPSSMDFDTGVDDTKNTKWYIVWCTNMNRHILPECVVSYKSSHNISGNHGQLKASTDSKHVQLRSLLSKMKSFLPPNKFQEVGTLFETFKAGKFAKDCLVKQLRSIVGDEMLLSIMREIRG